MIGFYGPMIFIIRLADAAASDAAETCIRKNPAPQTGSICTFQVVPTKAHVEHGRFGPRMATTLSENLVNSEAFGSRQFPRMRGLHHARFGRTSSAHAITARGFEDRHDSGESCAAISSSQATIPELAIDLE